MKYIHLLFFLFVPFLAHAKQENVSVLSYEVISNEVQIARKLKPLNSARHTCSDNGVFHKKNYPHDEKEIREHVFLIDEMDVYSLSDLARFLTMNRMVSPEYYYSNMLPNNAINTDWQTIIKTAAQTYAVDENLIWAVIKVESNFVAHAISHKGAVGAMQLMPETQKELGVVNPTNARDNVFAGTKYLKQQLERFHGDIRLALAAYNAGAGNVLKYHGIPPFKETQHFVRKVLGFMQQGQ